MTPTNSRMLQQQHHRTQPTRRASWSRPAVSSRACEAPVKRYLTLPNLTYSNAKKDICMEELRQLYSAVHEQQTLACGSPTQRSFFQHWATLSEGEAQQKLQQLLDGSVAVAAAFTRDPHLYLPQPEQDLPASPSASGGSWSGSTSSTSSGSSSGSSNGLAAGLPWPGFPWSQRPPRRLVGFVRAAGDNALVATVHDLLIHPRLQGFGLGAALLRRLLAQVSAAGVYDVGLVTPASLAPFFHSASFDLDREDSVPMALALGAWAAREAGGGDVSGGLQGNAALLGLLQLPLQQQQHGDAAAGQQPGGGSSGGGGG